MSRVRNPMRWISSIYLNFPAALGSGVYSASNRNEHQKNKKCFGGVERGRCLGLTTLPPSVSRLSRQYGILNISHPYRPSRPVMGIALLYFYIHYLYVHKWCLDIFFYFLQIYNLLYKLSNKQICYKETLVRSDHPTMILLYILCIMLCVPLFFFLSLVL
jgi:hypothetical protein